LTSRTCCWRMCLVATQRPRFCLPRTSEGCLRHPGKSLQACTRTCTLTLLPQLPRQLGRSCVAPPLPLHVRCYPGRKLALFGSEIALRLHVVHSLPHPPVRRQPHSASGRHAAAPLVLPEAPWTRAGLLRFCLSDVLPYQPSEMPPAQHGAARLRGTVPEEWPNFEGGRRVRDLANAVKEVADVPLVCPLSVLGAPCSKASPPNRVTCLCGVPPSVLCAWLPTGSHVGRLVWIHWQVGTCTPPVCVWRGGCVGSDRFLAAPHCPHVSVPSVSPPTAPCRSMHTCTARQDFLVAAIRDRLVAPEAVASRQLELVLRNAYVVRSLGLTPLGVHHLAQVIYVLLFGGGGRRRRRRQISNMCGEFVTVCFGWFVRDSPSCIFLLVQFMDVMVPPAWRGAKRVDWMPDPNPRAVLHHSHPSRLYVCRVVMELRAPLLSPIPVATNCISDIHAHTH
jgi:hypothetical protein